MDNSFLLILSGKFGLVFYFLVLGKERVFKVVFEVFFRSKGSEKVLRFMEVFLIRRILRLVFKVKSDYFCCIDKEISLERLSYRFEVI